MNSREQLLNEVVSATLSAPKNAVNTIRTVRDFYSFCRRIPKKNPSVSGTVQGTMESFYQKLFQDLFDDINCFYRQTTGLYERGYSTQRIKIAHLRLRGVLRGIQKSMPKTFNYFKTVFDSESGEHLETISFVFSSISGQNECRDFSDLVLDAFVTCDTEKTQRIADGLKYGLNPSISQKIEASMQKFTPTKKTIAQKVLNYRKNSECAKLT